MKEIGVQEAYQKMEKDKSVVYLDVRSVAEFEQGHPQGAINIPLLHLVPGLGMVPNQDFVSVVEANVPKDATVLIGCKTGGRSAKACEILSSVGFTNVANVREGFLGHMDPMGRVIAPGWSLLNLPQCGDCPDDATYERLASKRK